MDLAIAVVLLLSFAFAFFNGFHDAGIIVGNIVATHGLTPRAALTLATVFNFVGALMGQSIAMVVVTELMTLPHAGDDVVIIIAGGVLGALIVNVVTYFMALPIASTHVLMGGLAGANLVAGWKLEFELLFDGTLLALFVVPLLALAVTLVCTRIVVRIVASAAPKPVYRRSRQLNSVMVAGLALTHGSQDAQKIGGVVAIVWAARMHSETVTLAPERPWLLIVSIALMLAAGTWYSGWRVARTVSASMVHLDPLKSAVANTTATGIMALASFVFSIPASMSFVVVASNLGSVMYKRHVSTHVVVRVVAAWVLGIPVAAAVAALCTLPLLPLVG